MCKRAHLLEVMANLVGVAGDRRRHGGRGPRGRGLRPPLLMMAAVPSSAAPSRKRQEGLCAHPATVGPGHEGGHPRRPQGDRPGVRATLVAGVALLRGGRRGAASAPAVIAHVEQQRRHSATGGLNGLSSGKKRTCPSKNHFTYSRVIELVPGEPL